MDQSSKCLSCSSLRENIYGSVILLFAQQASLANSTRKEVQDSTLPMWFCGRVTLEPSKYIFALMSVSFNSFNSFV